MRAAAIKFSQAAVALECLLSHRAAGIPISLMLTMMTLKLSQVIKLNSDIFFIIFRNFIALQHFLLFLCDFLTAPLAAVDELLTFFIREFDKLWFL